MSLNVFPTVVSKNFAGLSVSNPVASSNLSDGDVRRGAAMFRYAIPIQPANFSDNVLCEFLASGPAPSLSGHIGVVVCLGPKPQMVRVNAMSYVATVKYVHTSRDCATGKSPCKTMRVPLTPEKMRRAIPPLACSFPKPTPVRALSYPSPKVCRRFGGACHTMIIHQFNDMEML